MHGEAAGGQQQLRRHVARQRAVERDFGRLGLGEGLAHFIGQALHLGQLQARGHAQRAVADVLADVKAHGRQRRAAVRLAFAAAFGLAFMAFASFCGGALGRLGRAFEFHDDGVFVAEQAALVIALHHGVLAQLVFHPVQGLVGVVLGLLAHPPAGAGVASGGDDGGGRRDFGEFAHVDDGVAFEKGRRRIFRAAKNHEKRRQRPWIGRGQLSKAQW